MIRRFTFSIFLVFSTLFLTRLSHSDSFEWKWIHPSPFGQQIYFSYILNQNVFFMGGARGWFLKTTDAGQNWFETPLAGYPGSYPFSLYGQIYDGHVFDENNIILAGQFGATRTTNGGITFDVIPGTSNPNRDVADVFFLNSSTGYLSGATGYLRKSTDGGTTWSPLTGIANNTYPSISTFNDIVVIATTSSGSVIRSTDSGNNWTLISTGISGSLNAINFLNKDTIVCAGDNNRFIISTDAGISWSARNPSITNNGWGEIHTVNRSYGYDIYLNGLNPTVIKTTNLGLSWDVINMAAPSQSYFNGFTGVSVSDSGNIILGAGLGVINLKKSDVVLELMKGVRFGNIPGFTQSNNGISISKSGNKIWTVGEPQTLGSSNNQILYSSDAGNNWTFQPITDPNLILYDIQMLDENTGFITGSNGSFLKTTNGGSSWNISTIPTNKRVVSLSFINENTGWVLGTDSVLFKTTDSGLSWEKQKATFLNPPQNFNFSCDIEMLNENTGWLCGGAFGGDMAYINKTTNGGINWVEYPANVSIQATDICMLDANTGYLSASATKLRKTTDGGVTWDTLRIPFPIEEYDFRSIDFLDVNNGVTIDNGGATLITTNGGESWIFKLGLSLSNYMIVKMVSPFPNPLMFAVGGYSSVFKFGDRLTSVEGYTEWSNAISRNFSLEQNFPNPFNPETKIQFTIPKTGTVKLLIYDISGRLVKNLIDGVKLNSGKVTQTFTAADLSSGIYYYTLIFDGALIDSKKMVLLK